jgi:adenylate cyclase
MFTDMVGYTALTQADEAGALKLLDRHNQLLRPIFPRFHGREVKTVGDSFLVEFESALDATSCAVEIQRFLHEHNLSAAPDSKIQIRIGIHQGDVVHTADDVFGDSVNIASRIEPLAEAGGICITEPVFGQVRNKIPNRLELLGPKLLKNVRFSMQIYRIVLPWTAAEAPSASSGPRGLAVLPFANISPDPKDEYFADGLTEELITVLSQLPGLRVIARTSVMQYKSTTKAVSQIGTELSVASVLEGSVRKAGNRLRITAQLIDAESQGHVWAQTYERELDDVFAVQAELAKQVADGLKITLRTAEEARLDARPPVRPDSYLAYLKGRTLMHDTSEASLTAAKEQFELAVSLDERNAAAHSGLADATLMAGWYYADVPHAAWDATARRWAARAIELDPNLAEAHTTLALMHWQDFDYASAEREFKAALSLNPSYSLAHEHYGIMLEDQARADEALQELMLAEAADPLWRNALYYLTRHFLWLGRYDEALLRIRKLGELNPSGAEHHFLLASYHRARSELEPCLEEIKRAEEAEVDPRERPVRAALASAWAGEKERARALLKEAEGRPESSSGAASIAYIYGLLGDLDDCFLWLDKNGQTHNHPFQMFQLSPDFEPVRRDPRFKDVLRKMKLT